MVLFDDNIYVLSETNIVEILDEILHDHNVPHVVVLAIVTDFVYKLRDFKDESDCQSD